MRLAAPARRGARRAEPTVGHQFPFRWRRPWHRPFDNRTVITILAPPASGIHWGNAWHRRRIAVEQPRHQCDRATCYHAATDGAEPIRTHRTRAPRKARKIPEYALRVRFGLGENCLLNNYSTSATPANIFEDACGSDVSETPVHTLGGDKSVAGVAGENYLAPRRTWVALREHATHVGGA